MRLIIVGSFFALLLAAGAAHSADSIPADTAPAAAASDDDVMASDHSEEAANQALEAYKAHIQDVLRASNSPRDWVLAASIALDEETEEALSRAAEAAPDDALVQWLVANSVRSDLPASRTMAQAAANRLVKLEPDNGAAWLVMLDLAYQRGDHAAVADALARMTASTRFDAHYGDALHAWLPIFDRYPPDGILGEATLQEGSSPSFLAAVTSAQAMAVPAFQALFKACEDGGDVRGYMRQPCRDAARLMLHEGKTLIACKPGFGLLRKLGGNALSDTDQATQRELDCIPGKARSTRWAAAKPTANGTWLSKPPGAISPAKSPQSSVF